MPGIAEHADIELAFVVLSAALSHAELAARLGEPDELNESQSGRFTVWQLTERVDDSKAISDALTRLTGRALERVVKLESLRREPGAVDQVNLWVWAEVGEEGCGFTVAPQVASDLARLDANLHVRVWGWDEDPPSS